MKNAAARLVLIVIIGGAAAACDSSTKTTGPDDGGKTCSASTLGVSGTVGTGTFTAQIDGVSWKSACTIVSLQGNTLIVGGVDSLTASSAQALVIQSFAVIGTYTVNGASPLTAAITTPFVIGTVPLWQALFTTGSGQLALMTSAQHTASGTFFFSMPAVTTTPATGTKEVTNGVFDLSF